MANLGQLVVNLEANIARFTSEMGRASQVTEQAMSRMQAASTRVKNVLGAVGVALSVDLILGEINSTLNALGDLDAMAQKTGASVETLSKLGKVATFTATDFGSVDSAIVKLSKNLVTVDDDGNKTAKALAAIGISTDDIKNKDPAKLFVEIAGKLQGYEDGASKVALVTDLMGKSAAELLPYMNDVAESIDDFESESAEAAAQAAAFQDDLGRLKVQYEELKTEIISAAIPAITAFVGGLQDARRESDKLTGESDIDTWADDIALGLAAAADVAVVVARAVMALSGSMKVVAADVMVLLNAAPGTMAIKLAKGGTPIDDLRAAVAERDAVLAAANLSYDKLMNTQFGQIEQKVRSRIEGRFDAQAAAGADALAGLQAPASDAPAKLNYGGGEDKKKSDAEKAIEATEKLIGKLQEQRDTYGMTGAAVLEYQLAQQNIPAALAEKAVAIQQDIDKMEAAAKAQKEEADAEKERADARKKAQQEAAQAELRNASEVERIRQSLMTDVEAEQFEYESRIQQLQAFGAARLENLAAANALIEAETARHEQAKAELQASYNLESLAMAGDTADRLYSLLQKAGQEQTALAKAVFLAGKAIAVAEIILNTEVAAAKAGAQMGIYGIPMAAMIRATGYASAGMVAGMAIAEASAEGGYDIPAGVNPLTQLHEKEMVLPKAQADVIRGLATRGGGGDGGAMKLTIVNNTRSPIGQVTEQRVSATERALIIQEAVAATASTFADPNSQTSRAMSRNYNLSRSR